MLLKNSIDSRKKKTASKLKKRMPKLLNTMLLKNFIDSRKKKTATLFISIEVFLKSIIALFNNPKTLFKFIYTLFQNAIAPNNNIIPLSAMMKALCYTIITNTSNVFINYFSNQPVFMNPLVMQILTSPKL